MGHPLGELTATNTTTASFADVVRASDPSGAVNAPTSDLSAVLDTLGHTGAVSFILSTGNATGGCDWQVLATNDDPANVASPIWATVASGTASASSITVIFGSASDCSDHARHRAYKVQVRYHSGGAAQAVTLVGIAKS
jgi:hypothetical protein